MRQRTNKKKTAAVFGMNLITVRELVSQKLPELFKLIFTLLHVKSKSPVFNFHAKI